MASQLLPYQTRLSSSAGNVIRVTFPPCSGVTCSRGPLHPSSHYDSFHSHLLFLPLQELNPSLFPRLLCLISFLASIRVFFRTVKLSINTWSFLGRYKRGKSSYSDFFLLRHLNLSYQWTRTSGVGYIISLTQRCENPWNLWIYYI